MEAPITDIEKQRMMLSFEERLALQRATDYVKNRLFQEKIRDRERQWHTKESQLRDNELAMLNILEDARTLEEQLEEQRKHLDLIIASMGEGLLLIDETFRIAMINAKAAALLNIRAEDAKGKDARTVITVWRENERLADIRRPAALALTEGKTTTASFADNIYYQTPAREKFPVSFTVSPLSRGEKVKHVIIIFRDITEEKALDEARTNFISVASHQLRTPLTAVRWYAELLMDQGMGTLTKLQERFVRQITAGADRLGDTINLLLSLARVEGKSLEINPQPITVTDLAKEMLAELSPLAKKEGVTLAFNEPTSEIPVIMFDAAILREVMANIITNAIRYSWKGGAVTISLSGENNEITVAITDTGIGIPASAHDRVYEKFFRADNAVKKAPEGTGLGLPLVRSLVSLWNGKLWFTSEEGKGTTFFVTIPYRGMQEKKAGKPLA